jgi:hypothetical protein
MPSVAVRGERYAKGLRASGADLPLEKVPESKPSDRLSASINAQVTGFSGVGYCSKDQAMRMNDEQYFRSCVAQERHLAHLLGHRNIEECYENAGTLWDSTEPLPKWTRDWKACGPLLAKYELSVSYGKTEGEEHNSFVSVGQTVARFSDHPTKDRAVMYAIVKAVIFLLEHRGAGKNAHHHHPQHYGPH